MLKIELDSIIINKALVTHKLMALTCNLKLISILQPFNVEVQVSSLEFQENVLLRRNMANQLSFGCLPTYFYLALYAICYATSYNYYQVTMLCTT